MNKFILVHDAKKDASPIILNTKNIIFVESSEVLVGASWIQLNDSDMNVPDEGFHVTETREQIFEMLK